MNNGISSLRLSPVLNFEIVPSIDDCSLSIPRELLVVAPKKTYPFFRSPIRTRSCTRMENQQAQQSTISVAEFNRLKDKVRGLTQVGELRGLFSAGLRTTLPNSLFMTLYQDKASMNQRTLIRKARTFQIPPCSSICRKEYPSKIM